MAPTSNTGKFESKAVGSEKENEQSTARRQSKEAEANAGKPRKHLPINMEKALEKTGFGKFNYFIIILSGVVLSSVGMETLGLSFVLPVSQCDLKMTTEEKGIVSGMGYAGIISSALLWGFLSDTQGRRRVILPSLMIAFSCTLASTLTNNFWFFAAFRYLNGFL